MPDSPSLRERVARIVDPDAWRVRDQWYKEASEWLSSDEEEEHTRKAYAERALNMGQATVEPVFAKADEIDALYAALLPQPEPYEELQPGDIDWLENHRFHIEAWRGSDDLVRLAREKHNARIDRIKSRLQAGGGERWLPIESAPRDGTWFIACATQPGWGATRIVRFADFHDRLPTHGEGNIWPSPPTHWMPLPTPPANGGQS